MPPELGSSESAEWFVAQNGQQSGPHTLDQVRTLAQAGKVTAGALAWKPNMPDWKPISMGPADFTVFPSREVRAGKAVKANVRLNDLNLSKSTFGPVSYQRYADWWASYRA